MQADPRQRVLEFVRDLQGGEVMTYGEVARACRVSPREVGWIMAGLGDSDVPWWRVVAAGGVISTFRRDPELGALQLEKLRGEGLEAIGPRRIRLPQR